MRSEPVRPAPPLRLALALALGALAAQLCGAPALAGETSLRPITAAPQRVTVRVDPLTGTTSRVATNESDDGASSVTVYDNTCLSNYFFAMTPSYALGDWGAIPSTAAAGSATCTPGIADSYAISEFTIGYCTYEVSERIQALINFWNGPQNACTTPTGGTLLTNGPPPVGSFDLRLPRASSTFAYACYIVQVQVDAPGFTLDGGTAGLTDLGLTGDRFAWSVQMPNATFSNFTGPFLAGYRPQSCSFCVGTIWEVGGQTTSNGLGLGQTNRVFYGAIDGTGGDCYRIQDLAGATQTWSGLWLELDAQDPGSVSPSFCDASDGALAACPCGNAGTPDTGCDNAQGTGGVRVDLAAQTTVPNAATLVGSGFPSMASPTAIVLRSNALAASPVAFGDGVRCLAASPLVRLAATTASGGTSTHAFGHAAMAGAGTFHYQLWYRSTPSSYCVPSASFNLSNGTSLVWP